MKFKKANIGYNLILNSQDKANLVSAIHTLRKIRELATCKNINLIGDLATQTEYQISDLLDENKAYMSGLEAT